MGRYIKYTENQLTLMQGLRLEKTEENPLAVDLGEISKSAYKTQLIKDRGRAHIIELRTPQSSTREVMHEVYNFDDYENYPRFGQGDYDATLFDVIFSAVNPEILHTIVQSDDQYYKTFVGFSYFDNQDVQCAFCIYRYGHEPAQYILTIIRNTHAPYEQREVTFIADEALMSKYYPELQGKHGEERINERAILEELRTKINSEPIHDLIATLFNEEGKITEENYEKLKARVKHNNLDNRDLLLPQMPRILENIARLPPAVSQPLKNHIALNSRDFFEAGEYNKFLSSLVKAAAKQKPINQELIANFEDIYLEYLTLNLYFNNTAGENIQKYVDNGIPREEIKTLLKTFQSSTQLSGPRIYEFANKANQFYKNIHFNFLLRQLEDNIHDSDSSAGLKKIASSHLIRLQKISTNFATYSSAQQQTILGFTAALASFVDNPNDASYNKLYALYPKLKLNPSSLEELRFEIEKDTYRKQMRALRENIASCAHPYLQEEIKKNLRFLQQRNNANLQEHITRNQFLKLLNAILIQNKASKDEIKELKTFYSQLGLPDLNAEQERRLLQPLALAQMQKQIDVGNYVFDIQGHILVTTLSADPKHPFPNYSLDVTNSHPEIAENFTQLLTKALEKQTTSQNAARILTAFNTKKMAVFPLQQFLQTYLTQMAQTYQAAMQEQDLNLNNQSIQNAILATLREISPNVITILAQELANASNFRRFNEMLKIDMETLNTQIIAAKEKLCQDCKAILINNLQKEFHSQSTKLSSSTSVMPKKDNQDVYFDATQPFAYIIETKSPEPDYLCTEIKTYHSTQNSLSENHMLTQAKVQTNALNFTDNLSNTAFQNQFKHRLTKIAHAYEFRRPNVPLALNLYSASEKQIHQHLLAAHHYNRSVQAVLDSRFPLCFLQTWNLSHPSLTLGYPTLDLNGTISEATLMCEMAFCKQIVTQTNDFYFNIQPYQNFLTPSTSILGSLMSANLFAFSNEGKKMHKDIQGFKTQWQQGQYAGETNPKKIASRALQKLMAFNLHYMPEHALLTQSLSVSTQDKSLFCEDEEPLEQTMRLGLAYAQILDLPQLPEDLKEPFNMLLCATDKRTATLAANLIADHLETYYKQHANSAILLTSTQNAVEAARISTSPEDIARTVSVLREEPKVEQSDLNTTKKQSIASTVRNRNRLWREKGSEESADLFDTAARKKAAAFGRSRGGSDDSG